MNERQRLMKAMKRYGPLTSAMGLAVAMLAVGMLTVASPAWAAFPGDNGKIAFTKVPTTFQNQEIWAVDADGSNPTNLTNNPALDTHAAWSADGTKIAFTSARDGNNEIYTMNADGTEQTNVSNSLKDEILPAWSPDDTKIAFRSDRDGNPEIYTMNADGSDPIRLTNNAGEDSVPAWSPDGTKIAFSSNRDGNYEIYAMNADGSDPINLSNDPAVDLHPAWSPNGTEIAFESTRAGNYEIYKMNADGSSPTNLSNNPRTEAEPDWSPDGTEIVFRSQRDNDNEIYTMNATDGSDPNNVSNDLGMIDYWPSWQPLTNSAPTAEDDPTTAGDPNYSVDQDGSLTVSASDGVLDNDTDPEDDTLTAMKASDPTNGTLTLSFDGSFTYTPSAGYSGTDSFTYMANDGTADSNTATVTITVNAIDTAPPSVTMTGPADGTIVNGTVTLSADGTDDVAVDRVEFLVNGSVVDTDSDAPYGVEWDSSSVADGPATIAARAFDTSSNQATSASRTVTVRNAPPDTSDPRGTVLINGGREFTDSRTAMLRLSASDPSPTSGVASMRFKNGGTHEWSSWRPYATRESWMLSAGVGTKIVHAQYQDNAGNRSDVVHDRIRYRR